MTFSVLPDAVRAFRALFPDVQLDLVEALSEYQFAHLRQGRIDIGISRFIGDVAMPDDLVNAVSIDDPLMAAVPLDHPLAGQSSVSAAELITLPFILYPKDPRSPFGQQIVSILRAAGADPIVAYEAVEIYTALSLVGQGWAVRWSEDRPLKTTAATSHLFQSATLPLARPSSQSPEPARPASRLRRFLK